MKRVPPPYVDTQRAFTAHVRAPLASPVPADVAPQRMAIYRELLRANIIGSLNACFPVLQRVLAPARWHALREDFFARHRCRTPIYRRVPDEFMRYLETEYAQTSDDPPFLIELAHYEWVELALSIDPAEISEDALDPLGDLWDGTVCVNPLAWLLEYRFPVHRIGPTFQPQSADVPTFIVVYRDRRDEIGFMELNAMSARVLAVLQEGGMSGSGAVSVIANKLGLASANELRAVAMDLFALLRDRDVILGATKLFRAR